MAQPHTPDAGCNPGFTVCNAVCADVTSDSRHCGGCGNSCVFVDGGVVAGLGCVAGACVMDGGCPGDGISCEGTCVRPRTALDDCGSCGNRCSDRQLCVASQCTSALGNGTACQNPLVIAVPEGEFQFRWSAGVVGEQLFSCGPLQPIVSRFFRYTAPASATLKVGVVNASGPTWLEAFSEVSCAAAVSLGCKDQTLPTTQRLLTVPVVAGQTYFFVVGTTMSSELSTLAIAD